MMLTTSYVAAMVLKSSNGGCISTQEVSADEKDGLLLALFDVLLSQMWTIGEPR